jgi:deoxyribodipyrimidine photolyase-related protein
MRPIRPTTSATAVRNLVIVLGDQLNAESTAFEGFDPASDAVWMAEVAAESTRVWSHQARIAVFLSAMRHFRDEQRNRGRQVIYRELDAPENTGDLATELETTIRQVRPRQLVVVEPGEWRVREALVRVARERGVPLEIRADRHFLCSTDRFAAHAAGRKQLRMEFFYREMRREHRVLMDGDQPAGGAWNFDSENRSSFGGSGPGELPAPVSFPPDAVTREVLALVKRRFGAHPGRLDRFDWPVTAADARAALKDFLARRLPNFGRFQDAMWTGEPWLYHSRLSSALNLKLLDPREAIAGAERAWRSGHPDLAAVEGFVRQILGWREYVRGIYWRFMPEYLERNALEAHLRLPKFYWTGETDMACLRAAIGQTLELGYAHHIQRLMVTGLYALLLGVEPKQVHEWYLAVYVDAVEWVELPNTLGMSQYADGGVMASKPYVASGKYLQRMSNYCAGCRFDPAQATGPRACPFTTLYWDFLLRHETRLRTNPRMTMQVRNLRRLDALTRQSIRREAENHRERVGT